MNPRKPSVRKEAEETGKFSTYLAIVVLAVTFISDQAVEPKIDVPLWGYATLAAIAVGSTKSVRNFIDNFFGNRQ